MNTLAGLGPGGANNLGQFIPVATADTTTYSGSDYYEIGLKDYTQQFHSDLPATTRLRGYYQKNLAVGDASGAGQNHYLGPVIIAKKDRPVRIKFINEVGIGSTGNLFVPVDKSLMGVGLGPLGEAGGNYTENRATLHLHGGNNPWISDGTQHQWTTPVGENTTSYKKGLSVGNVPDMGDPGDGKLTFYWPNQQSSRLLFYHDHAYGITRLNVYAGEAAGYLLYDDVELGLVTSGVLPDNGGGLYVFGIPLVIQDKTFVQGSKATVDAPATGTYVTDPTWADILPNSQAGDLWLPHVYMPNQWPDSQDLSGANPMGRWDYGPWFWPPYTGLANPPITLDDGTAIPGTPNPTIVPEAFMDTPLVNGTAYPVLPVARKAYRFRVLNACNDRFLNLQLYIADPTQFTVPGLSAADSATRYGTELKMVPAVPHPGAAESEWPARWPTDAREGGVPDPASAGPSMVQIGTEGGLLPAPVVIPPTPVGFNYNRRDIVVLNVASHALFLGPAERADIIVDFSGLPAGTSLILYNDAPAPVPAFDPRYDYYTDNTDLTEMGGAPTTLPGHGPNTRTIMQFQVIGETADAPYNLARLEAELPKAFAAAHAEPIVPQAGYNAAYTVPATDTTPALSPNYVDRYVKIQDTNFAYFDGPLGSIAVTAKGSGYTAPTITISHVPGEAGTDAQATATLGAVGTTLEGKITAITLIDPGSGYKAPPKVIITDPTGTGAVATPVGPKHVLLPKAIQELFEPDYGRMNSILGVEIPNTSATIQTTIPYYNIDPPTEIVKVGQGQFWKITHNGVDTHAIHFHLFDVQIINRVGWDGAIRPPDANELGWKDTVRMNPLEDIIVALKPLGQDLPWQLPNSIRPMDVTRPVGGPAGFTGIDPFGNPFTVLNDRINFGYEYVWHCHLLGHEENDMMRPVILTVAPAAPDSLAADGTWGAVTVSWADNSLNETGFTLQRARDPGFTTGLTDIPVPPSANNVAANGSVTPGSVNYIDATAVPPGVYYYRVRSTNGVGHPTMLNTSDSASSAWSDSVKWPVDKIPPVTTVSLSGNGGQNGWYLGLVRVTLNATDNLSGVAATYYTVDGGAVQTYSARFNVSGNAIHQLTYWSVDGAGNVEATKSRTIRIDSAAPLTTVALAGIAGSGTWYRGPVTVTLTGTDSPSGIDATYSTLDTQNRRTYSVPFVVNTLGAHTLRYYSVDVAGNQETQRTRTFGIDPNPPLLTVNTPASVRRSPGSSRSINITGNVSDAISGLAAGGLTYSITSPGQTTLNGSYTVGAGGNFSFTTARLSTAVARTYAIAVSAVDNAGNTVTVTVNFVVTN